MRPPKLKRSMGLWMATALVVGNMIGSGVFLLPASLAGTAGPDLDARLDLHRRGRDPAGARVRQPRPRASRAPAVRTPTRGGRSATSSASRPPGATGSPSGPATPRSPSPSSATSPSSGRRLGTTTCSAPLVGIGADLAAHGDQHPRRARERARPGGHDGPEVRPARRDRHHRPVLHRRQQLRAVRARTARASAASSPPRR